MPASAARSSAAATGSTLGGPLEQHLGLEHEAVADDPHVRALAQHVAQPAEEVAPVVRQLLHLLASATLSRWPRLAICASFSRVGLRPASAPPRPASSCARSCVGSAGRDLPGSRRATSPRRLRPGRASAAARRLERRRRLRSSSSTARSRWPRARAGPHRSLGRASASRASSALARSRARAQLGQSAALLVGRRAGASPRLRFQLGRPCRRLLRRSCTLGREVRARPAPRRRRPPPPAAAQLAPGAFQGGAAARAAARREVEVRRPVRASRSRSPRIASRSAPARSRSSRASPELRGQGVARDGGGAQLGRGPGQGAAQLGGRRRCSSPSMRGQVRHLPVCTPAQRLVPALQQRGPGSPGPGRRRPAGR